MSKNKSFNSLAASSDNIITELAAVSREVEAMFSVLESRVSSFVDEMKTGFTDISSIIEELLGTILRAAGGGGGGLFESLFSFIPGGGIVGSIIDMFAGLALPGAGLQGNEHTPAVNYPEQVIPNISVIVQSEVEQTKAVKFLTSYMPVYNTRSSGSAL